MEKSAGFSQSLITHNSAVSRIALICGFTALTAVGAQIEIPHQPVPFTLQTMFVLLAGALLGRRDGMLSQVLYVVAGASGLPVFAHWSAGIMRLAGPTGGYLLSFPVAAFVVGYLLRDRSNLLWMFIVMTIGLLIIFSLGTLQLELVFTHNLTEAISSGFLIFSWWDILKLCAAAMIAHQFSRGRQSA